MIKIKKQDFISCYEKSPLILTEGAVGLRISQEYGIEPDRNIRYASLIYNSAGRKALENIYRQYLQAAEDYSLPIFLMTNTRRVNKEAISLSAYKNKNVISDYAEFLRELAGNYRCETYIGGAIGCKGDAYSGENSLSYDDAVSFHEWQVNELKNAEVDFIFESIMPVLSEILGMSELISHSNIPYIISLMIRRNGKISDGHTIHGVIDILDGSLDNKPLCYMTNCVHPDILKSALNCEYNKTNLVRTRFKGIQANAACAEPEELEALSEVISSNADELANSFLLLNETVPMKICGGCCGTNETHIREIARILSKK